MIFVLVKLVVKFGFLSVKLRFFNIKNGFLSLKNKHKLYNSMQNTNLAINQWKSIDHLFDLFLALIVWVQ